MYTIEDYHLRAVLCLPAEIDGAGFVAIHLFLFYIFFLGMLPTSTQYTTVNAYKFGFSPNHSGRKPDHQEQHLT